MRRIVAGLLLTGLLAGALAAPAQVTTDEGASILLFPRVVVGPEEILWLNIDHRGGFLLSQIDGSLTVDDLYALSGMGRMETAKILAELLEAGVIEMT